MIQRLIDLCKSNTCIAFFDVPTDNPNTQHLGKVDGIRLPLSTSSPRLYMAGHSSDSCSDSSGSVYTPVFKFDVIIEPIPLLAMPSPCGTVCSPGAGIIIGCPTPTGPTSERDVARSSSSDDRPGPGPFGAIVTIGISSCPTV